MPALPSMPSKAQKTTGQAAPSSFQFARSGGASFCGVGRLVTFSNSTTVASLTSQSTRRNASQQSQQKAQSGESIEKLEDAKAGKQPANKEVSLSWFFFKNRAARPKQKRQVRQR